MAPVVVRPARDADAPALAALLVGGSREPGAEDPGAPGRYAAAIRRVRDQGGEVLVAELDAAVVGMCQVTVLEHVQHAGGRAAELESVHVLEAHRGRGVGRRLVDEALAWATARGCYRAQLTSHVSRDAAHRLYERAGFAPSHVGYKRALVPDVGST